MTPLTQLTTLADPVPVKTVNSADDGWYRSVAEFAQRTAWLHGVMSALTVLLIGALAVMVLWSGWRAWRRADQAALTAWAWTCVGTGVSVVCGLLLKQVFQETRPCLAMPNVATVEACPGASDYSFPSDHTIVAAALAAGLWLIDRKLGAIGAGLVLLEGFSRVYLGQHYPHDVVAAVLISCLIVFGGWPLARRPLSRLVRAGVRESPPSSSEAQ